MEPIKARLFITGSVSEWPIVADHGGIMFSRTLGTDPDTNAVHVIHPPPIPIEGGPRVAPPSPGEALLPGAVVSLEMSDGVRSITFPDLTVHEISYVESTGRGQTYRVTLKDWRYRHQRGEITGEYNKPTNGVVFTQSGLLQTTKKPPEFRRTLRQLVHLLFSAMGVDPSKYDTTLLRYLSEADADDASDPHDPDRTIELGDDLQIYPAVRWEFTNPSSELERLLAEYGYAISLWGPAKSPGASIIPGAPTDLNDRMVVVRLNKYHPHQASGFSPLPGFNYDFTEDRRTSSNRPTNIVVVGGRIEREIAIQLIPVGIDIDGSIKRIEELSYAKDVGASRPYGAFDSVSYTGKIAWRDGVNVVLPEWPTRPNQFPPPFDITWDPETGDEFGIFGRAPEDMLDRVREKASASIWKFYQLPKNYRWLLPILQETARTQETEFAVFRRGPIVRVRRYGDHDDKPGQNRKVKRFQNPLTGVYETPNEGYSIDFQQGIVKFDERAVLKLTPGTVGPAEVWLRFSYASATPVDANENYTAPETAGPDTELAGKVGSSDYYAYPSTESIDARTQIIRRPELVLYEIDGTYVNTADLDAFSASLIEEARRDSVDIVRGPEGTVPYIVRDNTTDGIFRQITWQVGPQGADTTIVANRENPNLSLSKYTYEERIFQKKVANRGKDLPDIAAFDRGTSFFSIMGSSGRGGGSGGGGGVGPGRGKASTDPRIVRADAGGGTVAAQSYESTAIPAHSFVRITFSSREDSQGAGLDAGLVIVRNPYGYSDGGIGSNDLISHLLAVTLEEIPPGGVGMIQHSGFARVRVAANVLAGNYIRPGNSGTENGYIGYNDGPVVFPVVQLFPLFNGTTGGNMAVIKLQPSVRVNTVYMLITGATRITNAYNQWRYSGRRCEMADGNLGIYAPGNDSEALRIFTNVLNTIEMNNDGIGLEGHGVNIDPGSELFPRYPAGFAVQPIAPTAIVPITLTSTLPEPSGLYDTRTWVMTEMNADDGVC